VPLIRDNEQERVARINGLLEELRLNTQDLHEIARQAVDRARAAIDDARQITTESQGKREARRKPKK